MAKVDRIDIFKKLYPFIKNQKTLLVGLFIIKVLFMVLILISPLFYYILIEDVMVHRKIFKLTWVIVGYVGIYLLQTLGVVINKIIHNKLFIKLNLKLRTAILTNYTKMKTLDYVVFDAGDLKNRIEKDIAVFEKFYNSHCLDYIFSVATAVIISIILLSMNWMLAVFGFVMVPLSFLFTKIMGQKAGKVSEEYRDKYGKYEGFLHNSLQNWKEIKANNLEENEAGTLKKYWDVLSKLFVKRQIYWYINRVFIAFKDFFITKMNLYFLGGLLIINEQLEVAALLVFMSYYEQFFGYISSITDSNLGLKEDRPSIDRVLEMVNFKVPDKIKVKIISNEIKIENVNFKYNDTQDMVLNDVSLNIGEKEHIVLVGRSGCGKSTLVKLLLGMYEPLEGNVIIGNYNISEIGQKSVNRKISIVMQEPMLFNLSIKENLLFAKKKASIVEIEDVCRKANILEFIKSLPDGFETIIGERGVKLSGGQKQRLAIARTILFDPEIIIFDEATSSLDYESEKAIIKSIKTLSEDKTIISIAHRLSTALEANRVVVMDKGRIIAEGKHDELKDNNEIYDLLFKKQYKVG